MQILIPVILVGLLSGVAVGVQSPLASMITQRLGMFESIFIIRSQWLSLHHLTRGCSFLNGLNGQKTGLR